jgi:hypothetical protein
MLDATDGPQAVALNQHGHSIQKHGPICAKRVKEGAFVSTKSMVTSRAVITMFDMTIDFDVVSTYCSKIPTEFLVTPLSLSFHRASPRLGRCAQHTSKMGFPGLGVQHPLFHRVEFAGVSFERTLSSGGQGRRWGVRAMYAHSFLRVQAKHAPCSALKCRFGQEAAQAGHQSRLPTNHIT